MIRAGGGGSLADLVKRTLKLRFTHLTAFILCFEEPTQNRQHPFSSLPLDSKTSANDKPVFGPAKFKKVAVIMVLIELHQ